MVGNYNGKVVIITGSSAGIGQAGAILFAKAGASVTIHGRSEEKLQKTIELIVKAGGSKSKVLTVVGEIIDENVQKNLINKTIEKFGKIDVLVNNAGIQKKPGEEHRSMDNLDYVLDVNLKAPIAIIELAIPHLEKTKGNIINVSSVAGQKTVPPFPFYSIAKAGLDHACRNYADILASKGIRVNNLSPGATDSEFATRHGVSEKEYTMLKEAFSKIVPLQRFASSEEMAKYLLYIASEDFSYMTGQLVSVDGGSVIAAGHGFRDLNLK